MAGLKQRAVDVYSWFEQRLGLGAPAIEAAEHEVPSSTSSWWYVFGSAATVILVLQVVTGILLALVYAPTASHAWTSLEFLDHNVRLGWFLRALHGWGSDFMVAIVLIHLVQVFLFGAYKFPRELTWIVGVFLLLLTLGMAFTGQVLRFDQDAYWGLGIGASILSRVPWIGGPLVDLMLGGPIIAGPTLSRFFALHVFVIPGILLGAGRPAPADGAAARHQRVADAGAAGAARRRMCRSTTSSPRRPAFPLCPMRHGKTPSLPRPSCLPSWLARSGLGPSAPRASPTPPSSRPLPSPTSPSSGSTRSWPTCRPASKLRCCSSRPILGICAMLLLPLLFGEGEKHWSRRPVAVLMVAVIAVTLGIFTRLGMYTPWSPVMNAWSSDPIPAADLKDRTPLEREGAIVLQNKQCRNCHSIGGAGGMRGPALDSIASRMTEDQIIRQVLQGGGNMPAYGNALNPSETTALVHFLLTLRGGNLISGH